MGAAAYYEVFNTSETPISAANEAIKPGQITALLVRGMTEEALEVAVNFEPDGDEHFYICAATIITVVQGLLANPE